MIFLFHLLKCQSIIKHRIKYVTVDFAENDYFTVATNLTTFTVEKLASKITASLLSITYNIGKDLVITLKDEKGKFISDAV